MLFKAIPISTTILQIGKPRCQGAKRLAQAPQPVDGEAGIQAPCVSLQPCAFLPSLRCRLLT